MRDLIDVPDWQEDDEKDDLRPARGVFIAAAVTALLWLCAIWALFDTGILEW